MIPFLAGIQCFCGSTIERWEDPILFFCNKFQPPKALGNSNTVCAAETWVLVLCPCLLVMALLSPTIWPDLENPELLSNPTHEAPEPECAQRLPFVQQKTSSFRLMKDWLNLSPRAQDNFLPGLFSRCLCRQGLLCVASCTHTDFFSSAWMEVGTPEFNQLNSQFQLLALSWVVAFMFLFI